MVSTQLVIPQTVYIHKETTNQSFIDMHYYLKQTGRKNNDFMLILYDSNLRGVDPRDPNLPYQMKQRVLIECTRNFWYFVREVVRIPVQGGTVRYKLHRGNLAMNYLFIMNYNMFVELPRQHFKTKSALVWYLWCYNFKTSNSDIMFLHKDHGGSKTNLDDLKNIRDALPSYLQMSSATAIDGRKLKVPNTKVTIQHPINNNKIITFASARNKDGADRLGRGCTMPMQYYDEFAFCPYNTYVYASAIPAYSRAAENAKRNKVPYGILITTTPGDLTTEEGQFAYTIRNAATPWDESFYDKSYEEMEEIRNSNTNSSFFLVRYTYQQLGSGEPYFKQMVVDMVRDWPRIRREVLLEWAKTATNCPFKQDDLDIIKEWCKEPIRTIPFGRFGQYQFKIYEDIDLRYPPIVGVDVAGAMYQDSSAITVIDSRTTRVCATLNCNFMPTDDLADVLHKLATEYMQNCIINIERNGGFGISVIQRLVKTTVKKNLYFEIKDKVFEEKPDSTGKVQKMSAKVRVYGTDSTKAVRARLIEILYDRVNLHKDKFVAPILHDELQTMEVKKNGKVEHADGCHDDQVFSYLMGLYVWYDGINLMENFGIQKNVIKTDQDVEIDPENDMLEGTERVPLDETIVDEQIEEQTQLQEQLEYLKEASRYKLGYMYNEELYLQEQDLRDYNLATNKLYRQAYQDKYHIDANEDQSLNGTPYVRLPNSIFSMDDEEEDARRIHRELHGNLYDIFTTL